MSNPASLKSRSLVVAATAAAATVSLAGSVHAQTLLSQYSYSASTSFTTTGLTISEPSTGTSSNTIAVSVGLGRLTSVVFSYTGAASYSYLDSQTAFGTRSGVFTFSTTWQLSTPGGLATPTLSSTINTTRTGNLVANAAGAGPVSTAPTGLTDIDNGSQNLLVFQNTGGGNTYNVTANYSGFFRGNWSGGTLGTESSPGFTDAWSSTLTVQYYGFVPGPESAMVFLPGALGMGLAARRKGRRRRE